MNRSIIFVFFVLMSTALFAQTFELTGEFRFRPEFRNGYKHLPDSVSEAAGFVSQRNRIGLHYKSEKYETQFTLQEGRIWGDELLKSGKATIGIYEGWVSLKVSDSLKLRMGRQPLLFGNQRMFSGNNWSQTAQAHDAALLDWKSGQKHLYFVQAFNQKAENIFGTDYLSNTADIKDNYKTLTILRYEQKIKDLDFAVMGFADGFQDLNGKALYVRSTQGAEAKYTLNKFIFSGMGYYQTGHNVAGTALASWFAAFEAEYKADKWSAKMGGEILSGDDVATEKYEQFLPQYASNHTFAGFMDYFTNFATHTGGTGFIDTYLKGNYKLSKVHSLALDYHYFATQQNTITGGAHIDQFLAHEVDLTWKMAFAKDFNVSLGYSILSGSTTLELIQGRDNSKLAHWAYVMLEFKPTFLKYFSEKK
ncbi:MAG: hypothetical protein A2W93_04800 [Bacteroidetes bacterium GWF2_43_63]|nr:MAG: hypothetical protein A2W94_12790 [Bacteroidetes bacterium GWE2_42_42]OFY56074.1 MAG: hypothetical protein A2W93_04800 [Bacteroidetes bacterium GWF2_43_63]HBG70673.1 hypothetical protein [Bacteroidales bacterium]HCB62499.1 hypothetical protein [Bacteroidales bacterium]HCY21954.1 hypothetical protein [Bacteroidales bacterium]